MLVIDSSAWIEFYSGSATGANVRKELPPAEECILPTIVLYEVAKWAGRQMPERAADSIVADIRKSIVVPLEPVLAIRAAEVSRDRKLPMADAIIYATAQAHDAELLTCDAHFEGLPGVRYLAKTGA